MTTTDFVELNFVDELLLLLLVVEKLATSDVELVVISLAVLSLFCVVNAVPLFVVFKAVFVFLFFVKDVPVSGVVFVVVVVVFDVVVVVDDGGGDVIAVVADVDNDTTLVGDDKAVGAIRVAVAIATAVVGVLKPDAPMPTTLPELACRPEQDDLAEESLANGTSPTV